MADRKLSEHIWASEWECHGTDCCDHSCPEPHGLLLLALEEFRRHCGDRPLIITSGYRCNRHNAAVAGAEKSYHPRNLAADVTIADLDAYVLAELAEGVVAFRHGGIGTYPGEFEHNGVTYKGRIHVDIGPQRRWKG